MIIELYYLISYFVENECFKHLSTLVCISPTIYDMFDIGAAPMYNFLSFYLYVHIDFKFGLAKLFSVGSLWSSV